MTHRLLRADDWSQIPGRAFASWFSQLEGMRSPVAVGTRGLSGVDNLAVFNSMTHVGARPPLLALVFRPLTVERHTYDNLKATGVYTINHLPLARVDALHQTSAKYPAPESEFAAVGLTALASTSGAPYVAEATVAMQLRFAEEHHVAANDTVIVVGRVEEIRLPGALGEPPQHVNWADLNGQVVSGLYDYYSVEHFKTKAYAKTPEVRLRKD